MPYRGSLHTLIGMLADFGTFEGRTVTISVKNARDISVDYNPPLNAVIAREIAARAKMIFSVPPPQIAKAIDDDEMPRLNVPAGPTPGAKDRKTKTARPTRRKPMRAD